MFKQPLTQMSYLIINKSQTCDILTSLLPIELFDLEVKLFNIPFNYYFKLLVICHFPEMADNINHGSITILIKT